MFLICFTLFMLFIRESLTIIFNRETLFMLFMCVRLFMLSIMESSTIFFTKERLFMLFMFATLFMLFIRESLFSLRKDCLCFSNLHVQCIKVK